MDNQLKIGDRVEFTEWSRVGVVVDAREHEVRVKFDDDGLVDVVPVAGCRVLPSLRIVK